jgi:hypothetical protein
MNAKLSVALICAIPVATLAGFWLGKSQRPVVQAHPCPPPTAVAAPGPSAWLRPASPTTISASRLHGRQVGIAARCLCILDPHSARFLVDAYMAPDDEALDGLYRRGAVIPLATGTQVSITTPEQFLSDGFPTSGVDDIRVRSGDQIGQECYVIRGFLR